jgi:4-hydroxybenzoate polyprenyltransferase
MNKKNKILEYVRLLRFQTSAATSIAPFIGSLIMGQRDIFLLIIIFFIGLLCHIYGFVLNEYSDINVDKKSFDLKKKPLVAGTIPKNHAVYISLIACSFALMLVIVFFPSPGPIIFLLISIILSGIYDIFGKKITGSDFILAGGFFFFTLFGASTVSLDFTNLVYIVCCLSFFHILFINAVEAGLKDVDHDYIAGAITLVTVMGVRVINGKLYITKKFTMFAYSIKSVYIILILLAGLQLELSLWHSDLNIVHIVLGILLVIMLITLHKFLHLHTFNRTKLKRILAAHEISTYFLIPVLLSPLIGTSFTMIIIFLPFFWFIIMNFILYGTFVNSQV